jgi:DMSO reductase anchor subunit
MGHISWDKSWVLAALGLGLAVSGLISSTLHLGNPQRAWRAFSQWQSSWLSREGVLAVLTCGLFGLWVVAGIAGYALPNMLGYITAGLCVLTVFATAMIYAQLRPVPRWHSWLTPASYLGFSLSSGMLLMVMLHPHYDGLAGGALGCLAIAWAVKVMWWMRASKTDVHSSGSDTATATALAGYADVRLFEKPHMTKNYLMKEMVFEVGRKHAQKLRLIALLLGAAVPAALLCLSLMIGGHVVIMVLAVAAHLAGLFVERWLFFAEAEHVVSLYYGR